MDPFFAPWVDTLDFVTRLHAFDDEYSFSSGEFAVTVIDFSNMYSNFVWSDVRDAWRFWKDRFIEHGSVCQFTAQELSFAFWLFQPLPVGLFEQCAEALPFLDIIHCGALTLGEFLLAFVFGHTLFVAPGQGLYRQRFGFPMGTNAAPPFANLIDRYYEICVLSKVCVGLCTIVSSMTCSFSIRWCGHHMWWLTYSKYTPRTCPLRYNTFANKNMLTSWMYL